MQQEDSQQRDWYLVYSKPKQENLAFENLERQGYKMYLPRLLNQKRLRGRYIEVIEPLFPRYLFIHLNSIDDDWGPIRSTLGVANIVRFGNILAKVPNSLIDALLACENEEGLYTQTSTNFAAGDRVRFVEGAMEGYEGIFQTKGGKERVTILLDIAGRFAQVQVSQHAIELVNAR